MLQQPTDLNPALDAMRQLLEVPFWKHADFWISSIIGTAGVFVSFLAYRQAEKATLEAEKAKQAATEAGKTVKLQTMAVELSEVNQSSTACSRASNSMWQRIFSTKPLDACEG